MLNWLLMGFAAGLVGTILLLIVVGTVAKKLDDSPMPF